MTTTYYVWQIVCTYDAGWGPGLWHPDYQYPDNRIFRTRAAARAAMNLIRGDRSCWTTADDDGNPNYDPPTFEMERVPVYIFADSDEREAVEELRGRPLSDIAQAPLAVLRDTAAIYRGHSRALSRKSASLIGASSATHSYAFAAAVSSNAAAEIEKLIVERSRA
jgi:hypothetical protein